MNCEKCNKDIDCESDFQSDMFHKEGLCALCSQPSEQEKEDREKRKSEYMAKKEELNAKMEALFSEDGEWS